MAAETLLRLAKHGISIAMQIIIASVIATLATCLILRRPEYMPSISEAAATGVPRFINTFGVGSGGVLFLVSGLLWLRYVYSNVAGWMLHLKASITIVVHLVTCVCLITQAVIPIDMAAEMCIHRAAAAIFFLTSFMLCYLMGSLERGFHEAPGRVLFIRHTALAVGIIVLSIGGNLATAWGNLMSHNPRLAERRMLTGFALMQYTMVLSLLVYIFTFSLE